MEIGSINAAQNNISISNNNKDISNFETKTKNNKGDNKDKKVSEKEISSAVDKANDLLNDSTHLQFKIHKITKDIMVKIIDDKTGQVVKEIPPEKIIDMIANICETLGIFVNEKR